MSLVMCHVQCVTLNVSRFVFLTNGEVSRWRVWYQQGYLVLFFVGSKALKTTIKKKKILKNCLPKQTWNGEYGETINGLFSQLRRSEGDIPVL